MQLLLVGDNKDFSYLRNLLNQEPGMGMSGLDHAHSPEEALVRLARPLMTCCYANTSRKMARRCGCYTRLRRNGAGAPVIFLSDHMDEATVDKALRAVVGDFALASQCERPAIAQHHPACD